MANTICTRSSNAISFSRGVCTSPYYTVEPEKGPRNYAS
jgi:hypothetical protein